MKILHIDDNRAITDVFSRVLTLKGHEYHACDEGKKGLEKILNNDYDLVFLDLTMPKFSGFDLLDELEKNDHKNNIVIITATTLNPEQQKKLSDHKVLDIIEKPVSLKDLLQYVAKINPGMVKTA